MSRSSSSLIAVLACLVAGSPALAAGRIAALVPQIKPPPAPELRDRFHEAVSRGLATGGDEVVPASEVRLRLGGSDETLNCAGVGACLPRAVQIIRVEHVVATDIAATGKDYTIHLRLLDPTGRELAKADDACDICTVKEAEDAVARAAGKLAATARTLPVEPPPPPPKVEPPPPPPKVEPEPTPKVEPTPAPPELTNGGNVQKPERIFPWRALAITSLVIGVAGVAAGAPLIAVDGQPTCNAPNPQVSCPEVYNTLGGGVTLLVIGAAGLAASGVLFYEDHRARHRKAPAVSLLPMPGGAFATVGSHF
jgi:hypothetical protein